MVAKKETTARVAGPRKRVARATSATGAVHTRRLTPANRVAERALTRLLAEIDVARGSTEPAGATTMALAKLKASVDLHFDHEVFLSIHDGGLHLDSYDVLDTKGILRSRKYAKAFGDSLVPFAEDSCGNLWCLGARGEVIGVERQGPQGTFRKAQNLTVLLRSIVSRLKKGGLVVDETGGISEPLAAPDVVAATPDDEEARRIEHPLADEVKKLIQAGNVKQLGALLEKRTIRADGRFWWDESLIAAAAGERKREVVELLLAHGCPIDDGKSEGKRTALFTACWGLAPCAELVGFLLGKGADPNALTGYDGTPLHSAVMWAHADAIRLLVAAGGDRDAKNQSGESVLAAAKRSKQQKQEILAALAGQAESTTAPATGKRNSRTSQMS